MERPWEPEGNSTKTPAWRVKRRVLSAFWWDTSLTLSTAAPGLPTPPIQRITWLNITAASHSNLLCFCYTILFTETLALRTPWSVSVSITHKGITPNVIDKAGLLWYIASGNHSNSFPSPSHPAFGSKTMTLRESQGGGKEKRQLFKKIFLKITQEHLGGSVS